MISWAILKVMLIPKVNLSTSIFKNVPGSKANVLEYPSQLSPSAVPTIFPSNPPRVTAHTLKKNIYIACFITFLSPFSAAIFSATDMKINFYRPVEPNPPSPREVSLNFSLISISGKSTLVGTS